MSIQTTVVGSYPLPDWLAALPSEQALAERARHNAGMILAAVGRSTPPRRNRIVKR